MVVAAANVDLVALETSVVTSPTLMTGIEFSDDDEQLVRTASATLINAAPMGWARRWPIGLGRFKPP